MKLHNRIFTWITHNFNRVSNFELIGRHFLVIVLSNCCVRPSHMYIYNAICASFSLFSLPNAVLIFNLKIKCPKTLRTEHTKSLQNITHTRHAIYSNVPILHSVSIDWEYDRIDIYEILISHSFAYTLNNIENRVRIQWNERRFPVVHSLIQNNNDTNNNKPIDNEPNQT